MTQGPLGKLWREVWQFSKPMMAAYLAKQGGLLLLEFELLGAFPIRLVQRYF
jgi:hypothetical protein